MSDYACAATAATLPWRSLDVRLHPWQWRRSVTITAHPSYRRESLGSVYKLGHRRKRPKQPVRLSWSECLQAMLLLHLSLLSVQWRVAVEDSCSCSPFRRSCLIPTSGRLWQRLV